MHPFKLAIICGGPSLERGISLNSARSLLDHLQASCFKIIPIFVDCFKQFHLISTAQLYSNTPADFDFKLNRMGSALTKEGLKSLLDTVDLVFPVIHGAFGEDGELQEMLEAFGVPYVGLDSACCRQVFHKHRAASILREHGFPTLSQLHFKNALGEDLQSNVERFFLEYHLQRAIVKPAAGGSSIGVHSVSTPQETCKRIKEICASNDHTEAVLEPFCTGKEFTVVVLSNPDGSPVALIPTEIEINYANNEFFDYRKKYLPTNQASYCTPPHFSASVVEQIRVEAEQIFSLFNMRDFIRLDGWVMNDGNIYFTDINPISGMEQNSFLFRQSCLLGMTHREALQYIVKNACRRYGLEFPEYEIPSSELKKPVYVLFGSNNAERQVSLMSGTNVWLKLLQSDQFAPEPFLYDHEKTVWKLPYSYTLNHTVEEIYSNCLSKHETEIYWQMLIKSICERLQTNSTRSQEPQQMGLRDFFAKAKEHEAFVFIGLHGGDGEDGTLQKALESCQLRFNGSNSKASAVCMDKLLTGQKIQMLADPDLQSLPKTNVKVSQFNDYDLESFEAYWKASLQTLQCKKVIIKPRFDGCSAGIALLCSAQDLQTYCRLISQKSLFIPANTFVNQENPIEMPSSIDQEFLLEPYVETDTIIAQEGKIKHTSKEGWVELTVGIIEKEGTYHVFNPSITVAEGSILTLEEKFQGGTGINLTPPPEEILSTAAVRKIKGLIAKAAKCLGIQNYARLDIFFNRFTEKVILIEANSLPGLTPSTVIYHQGLAEESPLTPLQLLETIIQSKLAHCD